MRRFFLRLTVFTIFILNFSCQMNYPEYNQDVIESETYLKNWLICGPLPIEVNLADTGYVAGDSLVSGFSFDFLKSSGSEHLTTPAAGTIALMKKINVKSRWFYHENQDNILHFDEILKTTKNFVAYAYCQITCPEAKDVFLSMDCNNRFAIFCNGTRAFELSEEMVDSKSDFRIPMKLNAGENHLMVKMEFATGDFGFLVRFLNEDN